MKRTCRVWLLFVTLCDPLFFFSQTKALTTPLTDYQTLTMTRIGDGWMFGRRAAFRTYESSNHTEALVWYCAFGSEDEARHAVRQSLKAHKVTGRELIRNPNGRVIGYRIIAAPKQRNKAFMIVQRQGLNCWFIQSVSMNVAMRLDTLIEPPPKNGEQRLAC